MEQQVLTNDRPINTTYEPFAQEPEYIEGNRAFLSELPIDACHTVLDLACGTGVILQLMLERNPRLQLFGLDLSSESLLLGRKDLEHRDTKGGELESPKLIQGTADQLPFPDDWADMVSMMHAIHNLPDIDRLLAEIHRVMKPGALFAFNSSFYAGSQAPGTDHFYQVWWKGALRWVLERDAELRSQGKPGIRRVRGSVGKAFSMRWLSTEEWCEALWRNSFEVASAKERTIMMSQRAFETIGAYSGFARMMLSGYPVEIASQALVEATGPALEAEGIEEVPRLWLEVVARKAS
jgi:ubiquinone/menaquinone biosynthesis C-methylase UbiE